MMLTSLLNRARNQIALWRGVSRQRRELAGLSDLLLKDIGLSRVDAEREARRPFWDQASGYDTTLIERVEPQCGCVRVDCCTQP